MSATTAPAFAPCDVISSGTLRTIDLVESFTGAIIAATYGTNDLRFEDLKSASRAWRAHYRDPRCVWLGFEEEGQDLVSDLIDALCEVAPDGCTFGAHEGDGACFGFWPVED